MEGRERRTFVDIFLQRATNCLRTVLCWIVAKERRDFRLEKGVDRERSGYWKR